MGLGGLNSSKHQMISCWIHVASFELKLIDPRPPDFPRKGWGPDLVDFRHLQPLPLAVHNTTLQPQLQLQLHLRLHYTTLRTELHQLHYTTLRYVYSYNYL